MQTDYLFHGIKGFEKFAYYCYRYDMVSKEAKRRYKIVLFYGNRSRVMLMLNVNG